MILFKPEHVQPILERRKIRRVGSVRSGGTSGLSTSASSTRKGKDSGRLATAPLLHHSTRGFAGGLPGHQGVLGCVRPHKPMCSLRGAPPDTMGRGLRVGERCEGLAEAFVPRRLISGG